jgi:putative chitinase
MKHLKSLEEFKLVNEQLFKDMQGGLLKLFGAEEPGESPIDGDVSISASVSVDKKKNIEALIAAMKRNSITNPYTQKAILGVIGKESGFVPQGELTYSNTPADRIKKIFKSKLGGLSDSEVDSIKKDDKKFFDKIYGGRYGNADNEGYKYRGRGFNQITFKGTYQKMQDLINKVGKLGKQVDLVNNPDMLNDIDVAAEAAVLFFMERAADPKMAQKYSVKDINGFKDQETALKAMVNANAGWGNDITNMATNGLDKAREQAAQFDIKSLSA